MCLIHASLLDQNRNDAIHHVSWGFWTRCFFLLIKVEMFLVVNLPNSIAALESHGDIFILGKYVKILQTSNNLLGFLGLR